MLTRRTILGTAAGVTVFGLLPGVGRAAAPSALAGRADEVSAALAATDVVYLTPLRADGAESRCQAEVWFVADGTDVYVVTAVEAWRARAVRSGLEGARIWIGDLGVWTGTDGRYRSLPQVDAAAAFVTADADQQRVLELFGSKYPVSWVLWGPRFRNGLADGSRVMLRYRPMLG
jgi:hypothetical protein